MAITNDRQANTINKMVAASKAPLDKKDILL
jgi:hypothetical protein